MNFRLLEKRGGSIATTFLTAAAVVALGGSGGAQQNPNPASPPPVTYAAQGWTQTDRDAFYLTGQGSQIMPYAWFKALRRPDGTAFLTGDQLERYGYLRNDSPANTSGLPVGFVIDSKSNQVGMTCAACHTSDIEYTGKDGLAHRLRVDGAPAKADFQQFLTDLETAADATLDQPRFDAFAHEVLGEDKYSTTAARDLRTELSAWVAEFGDFMDKSLPKTNPWGLGRLDAFGMIFNRVAAKDLDTVANFAVADAPVRYPFLWYAPRQDATQWTGAVPNGLYILGLGRNTGEVFGVFAAFHPTVGFEGNQFLPTVIRFDDNSVDFTGLETLEEEVATLKPPPYPKDVLPFDPSLARAGKPLFQT
jgi:hypothetical protein